MGRVSLARPRIERFAATKPDGFVHSEAVPDQNHLLDRTFAQALGIVAARLSFAGLLQRLRCSDATRIGCTSGNSLVFLARGKLRWLVRFRSRVFLFEAAENPSKAIWYRS